MKGRPAAGPNTPMKFLGRSTGVVLNLRAYGPSSGFFIPKGYFSSTKASQTAGARLRAGGRAFYPAALKPDTSHGNAKLVGARSKDRAKLHGFRGRSFLDKSLTGLNREYGKRAGNLIKGWMREGL